MLSIFQIQTYSVKSSLHKIGRIFSTPKELVISPRDVKQALANGFPSTPDAMVLMTTRSPEDLTSPEAAVTVKVGEAIERHVLRLRRP